MECPAGFSSWEDCWLNIEKEVSKGRILEGIGASSFDGIFLFRSLDTHGIAV